MSDLTPPALPAANATRREAADLHASPVQAACVALLPVPWPAQASDDDAETVSLACWRVQELERTAMAARVSIARLVDGLEPQLHSVADLVWDLSPAGHVTARGAWLLSHVDDPRQGLAWHVYCAPGGHAWRMIPRYSPAWLREREREVMARLRGMLPLDDDPLPAATTGTPVWLDPLHAVVQDHERDRATVGYHAPTPTGAPAPQPHYVVKLRRRRLSLRPYRSLGFWLVDGVTRVRQPVER